MLLSMTGHGQATVQDDQVHVVAELRTVNNRFLKTNVNCDLDAAHQSKLENLVKQHINRGSVNLRIKTQMLGSSEQYKLNEPALRAYWLQLSEIAEGSVNIESLLSLPGLVTENVHEGMNEIAWPAVEKATLEALASLNQMRSVEGAMMEKDMLSNLSTMSDQLEQIKSGAPQVIEKYARKMTDRINQLLKSHDVTVDASDVIKEVGVFAEKCDISEETVRLGSHIEQFSKVLKDDESNGKKLDFLVQEMLRETNTIGSKANNFDIANHVVEIKTAIERIREMVQNVE